MDPTDRQEIIPRPSVRTVSFLGRLRVRFFHEYRSTAAIMTSSLTGFMFVHSVGDLHSHAPRMLHLTSHGDAASDRNTRASGWRRPGYRSAHSRASVTSYYRQRGLRARRSTNCVRIPRSFDHNWTLLCIVCPYTWEYAWPSWQITAETSISTTTRFRTRVVKHSCRIFNKELRYGIAGKFSFTLYMKLKSSPCREHNLRPSQCLGK